MEDLLNQLDDADARPSSTYLPREFHCEDSTENRLTITRGQPNEIMTYKDISLILATVSSAYDSILQGKIQNGEFNVWNSPPDRSKPPRFKGQLEMSVNLSSNGAMAVTTS